MNLHDINALLEDDFVVVVPTQGLSHHLQAKYTARQIENKKCSWPTPKVFSWNIWLRQLWNEQTFEWRDTPFLLSSQQSLLIWTEIIKSSKYSEQLLQIDALVKQIQATYRLAKQWLIDDHFRDYFLSQDAYVFQQWALSFEETCAENHWIDEANITEFFLKHPLFFSNKDQNTEYSKLAFYGFDTWNPEQTQFIDYLQEKYVTVVFLSPAKQTKQVEKRCFENEKKEIQAIADWIIDCHQTFPDAKIGVVIPNLHAKKTIIKNELYKRLAINEYLDASDDEYMPFTISLGQTLSEYPMIKYALMLLALDAVRINLNHLSLILRSVYIHFYDSEASQRHLLDAELKKTGQLFLSFQTIQRIHEDLIEEKQCPQFIAALEAFFTLKKNLTSTKTLVEWRQVLTDALRLFGWPGDRKLNSRDYQIWEQWNTMLEQLVSLSVMSKACYFSTALSLLNKLCVQNQFQPKTLDKNCFVMGLEGASGMEFDYCWFQGLHDKVWPENTKPNAFIPKALQRDLNMQGSSPEKALHDARAYTESLIDSCQYTVLSYPLNEDDRVLRPSPILEQYSHAALTYQKNSYEEDLLAQGSIEFIDNDVPNPIEDDQTLIAYASLFKDQAACPFSAFFRHRLHAETLRSTDIGLNAMDRGIIIHRVLQLFWMKVKNLQALKVMNHDELQDNIQHAVTQALQEQKAQLPEIYKGRLLEIEHKRLCQMVSRWLEKESLRDNFSIAALEKKQTLSFHGLDVHLRIDRIDRLDDGRFVIIDYKTGGTGITEKAWFGDRPDDPQMPLYAIAFEGEIAALAFARLKAGKYQFKGLTDTKDILPDVKAIEGAQWTQYLNDWESVLESLALDYRQGNIYINPDNLNYSTDFAALYRLSERVELLQGEDE